MWYCVVGWLVRRHSSDDVCSYRSRPESPVLYRCHLWFYPLDCRLVTKCTHAWSFLQQFLVVQSHNVTNFIFFLDTKLSLCSKYIVFQYAIFSFHIWLDHFFFLPVSVLFVRQPGTEKRTGNVASAQDWVCARTTSLRQVKYHAAVTRNNHNTDTFYSYFCLKVYFLVLKNCRFSLNRVPWGMKNLNEIFFFPLPLRKELW